MEELFLNAGSLLWFTLYIIAALPISMAITAAGYAILARLQQKSGGRRAK